MAHYHIEAVNSPGGIRAWMDFPRTLYANDPVWVCPLDMEVAAVFNPKKNPFLSHGRAARFVLRDEAGAVKGRVAAFINDKKAFLTEVPVGGMGFFEVVNDQGAAFMLFDAAKAWLAKQGVRAMDGPVNFGENDRFWGLLVDGYIHPGYGMPYNPPYYKDFFYNYGFQLYFQQVSKHLDISKPQPFPERFLKIYNWLKEKGNIRVEVARMNNVMKYGRDFQTIFNDAWQFHENFVPMSDEQMAKMINQLKMVLVEELAVFAYVDGEPAGFILALPDLNQIFKPYRGKLGILGSIKFLLRKRNKFEWYRKRGILTRARVVIMGVRPKFQKHGVETAMVMEPMRAVQKMGLKEIELSWVGDFNPKMRAVLDATGAAYAKTHETLRYHFDANRREEYHRARTIPSGTPHSQAATPAEPDARPPRAPFMTDFPEPQA